MKKIVLISLMLTFFGCNQKKESEIVKKSKEEKLLEVQEWIAETLRVPEAKYLSKKWVYDTYDLLELDLNDEKAVYEWLRKENLSSSCYFYAHNLMPDDEVSYQFIHNKKISTSYYIKLYKKILGNKYKTRMKVNNMYNLRTNNDFKKYNFELFPDKYCDLPKELLVDVLVKFYRDIRKYKINEIKKLMKTKDTEKRERWRLIYENYNN